MAIRKKSESGAYMSQYDTEVEKRLSALEAAVKGLQSHSHDDSGGDTASLQQVKNEIFEARKGLDSYDKLNDRLTSLVTQIKKKVNSDIDA